MIFNSKITTKQYEYRLASHYPELMNAQDRNKVLTSKQGQHSALSKAYCTSDNASILYEASISNLLPILYKQYGSYLARLSKELISETHDALLQCEGKEKQFLQAHKAKFKPAAIADILKNNGLNAVQIKNIQRNKEHTQLIMRNINNGNLAILNNKFSMQETLDTILSLEFKETNIQQLANIIDRNDYDKITSGKLLLTKQDVINIICRPQDLACIIAYVNQDTEVIVQDCQIAKRALTQLARTKGGLQRLLAITPQQREALTALNITGENLINICHHHRDQTLQRLLAITPQQKDTLIAVNITGVFLIDMCYHEEILQRLLAITPQQGEALTALNIIDYSLINICHHDHDQALQRLLAITPQQQDTLTELDITGSRLISILHHEEVLQRLLAITPQQQDTLAVLNITGVYLIDICRRDEHDQALQRLLHSNEIH